MIPASRTKEVVVVHGGALSSRPWPPPHSSLRRLPRQPIPRTTRRGPIPGACRESRVAGPQRDVSLLLHLARPGRERLRGRSTTSRARRTRARPPAQSSRPTCRTERGLVRRPVSRVLLQRHRAGRVAERHGRLRPGCALEPPALAGGLRVGRRVGPARRRQPVARVEPNPLRLARRHRQRCVRHRPAVVRHLRPGRPGTPLARHRRSARRSRSRAGARDRRVAIRGPHDDLLQRRPPAGAGRLRRLRVHRRHGADARRHRADHPGPVGDGRDEPCDPPSGQRRLPPLGGRRRGPPAGRDRSTAGRSRFATSALRRCTSARTRRSAASCSASRSRPRTSTSRAGSTAGRPAARAVPGVRRHDEGAQRARAGASGIQLSQVAVPTALNTGSNSGPSFCILFGTYVPFSQEQLDALYRNHGKYVSAVTQTDSANVEAGYLLRPDAQENQREAAHSSVGK